MIRCCPRSDNQSDHLSGTDAFQYGYDRASNRLFRKNLVDAAFSELYHANGASEGYDLLGQLSAFRRGTLSDSNSDDIKTGPYLRDQVLPGLLAKLDNKDLRRQCEQAGERYAYRFPDRPPFATPGHWAPFVATGLSYPLALA